MKLIRYNYIDIFVDCTLNYKGRDVKIKWTTEDGLIEDNFESVFFDLNDYDQAYADFLDEFPTFNLNIEGVENA
jgi:hypothetical protein